MRFLHGEVLTGFTGYTITVVNLGPVFSSTSGTYASIFGLWYAAILSANILALASYY